jgi:hypothetical protein
MGLVAALGPEAVPQLSWERVFAAQGLVQLRLRLVRAGSGAAAQRLVA